MVVVEELFKSVNFTTFIALIVCHKSPHFSEHVVLRTLIELDVSKIEAWVHSATVKHFMLVSFTTSVQNIFHFSRDSIWALIRSVFVQIIRCRIHGQKSLFIRGLESVSPCCNWAMNLQLTFELLEGFFITPSWGLLTSILIPWNASPINWYNWTSFSESW